MVGVAARSVRTVFVDRSRRQQTGDAIAEIVRFQEDVGLKSVTDGEFRRTYFHIDFLERGVQGVARDSGSVIGAIGEHDQRSETQRQSVAG